MHSAGGLPCNFTVTIFLYLKTIDSNDAIIRINNNLYVYI